MSKVNKEIITRKVKEWVSDGIPFTAYDVTRKLRQEGYEVSHYRLNDTIKSLFLNQEMTDYEADVVDIGLNVNPLLYYHQYSDPKMYDKDWLGGSDATDATTTPQVTQSKQSTRKDKSPTAKRDLAHKAITLRSRLSIAPAFVKSIGLEPGKEYFAREYLDVKNDENGIEITTSGSNWDKNSFGKVHVDGRIRINTKNFDINGKTKGLVYVDKASESIKIKTS